MQTHKPLRDVDVDVRKKLWQAENRAAAEASNAWIKLNGLPLATYTKF